MSIEFKQGDVVSYMEMCSAVGTSLQQGMNFRVAGYGSVFLMNRQRNALYHDEVDETGGVLLYEGHDARRGREDLDPKKMDQPDKYPSGSLTQNGFFLEAMLKFKRGIEPAEKIRVFEKVRVGIWVYNGLFELDDAWTENAGNRKVFKFHLRLIHFGEPVTNASDDRDVEDDRIIPSRVKQAVWKRDQGKCRICMATKHLHFDHIIPFSKGGSSKEVENIQILCGRHNLEKRDRIE